MACLVFHAHGQHILSLDMTINVGRRPKHRGAQSPRQRLDRHELERCRMTSTHPARSRDQRLEAVRVDRLVEHQGHEDLRGSRPARPRRRLYEKKGVVSGQEHTGPSLERHGGFRVEDHI